VGGEREASIELSRRAIEMSLDVKRKKEW